MIRLKGLFLLSILIFVKESNALPVNTQIPYTSEDAAEIMHLGEVINSPYTEYTPYITPDEKILFFESDRPGGVGLNGDYDLWFSVNRTPQAPVPSFGLPANLGEPVNTTGFDGLPSVRILGEESFELYFTSFASNGRTGSMDANIYYTEYFQGKWSKPVEVPLINSDFHDRMPSISADGHYLFFSSNRPGGYGKDDIWVSEYDTKLERWGKPINLGESVNTPSSEISPSIHVDGITLYFSSNRQGGAGAYDIYVTQMLMKQIWKKPQNIGYPYNSLQDDEYPTVLKSGQYMYFASNRPGGEGGFDIYRAKIPEFAKPMVLVKLRGFALEKNSAKAIDATIHVEGPFGKYDISNHMPDGSYELDFINNNLYEVTVSAPGYNNETFIFDTRTLHESVAVDKNFYLGRGEIPGGEINVRLDFYDNKGSKVAARSAYGVYPYMSRHEIISDNQFKVKIPDDELKKREFIRKGVLTIRAEADGYSSKELNFSIDSIIDESLENHLVVIPVEMFPGTGQGFADTPVSGSLYREVLEVLYFATGVSEKISAGETEKLKNNIEHLKSTNSTIELHGHTSKLGTIEVNKKLSLARAEYIKKLLVKAGIPAENITTYGHHYSLPAVEEKDDKSRTMNQRVEIVVKNNSEKKKP